MGRTEIPVYPGAEFPMLNTKEEWQLRQQLYGGHRLDPWMGAFNRANGGPNEIKPLPPPYDRLANLKPQQEHAARFIIKTVRENPGQVTIYAGGPLTNLALAIALAPDIVPLVPEVVIMGTGFHVFTNAFNIFFDPESARKVLRAAWPKCSIVTVDLAEEIHEGDEIAPGRRMIEEIAARAQSPISDLFQMHAVEPLRRNPNMHFFRMADEMIAAQVIDPSVFTKSEQMYVDICTTPGPRYGDSMFWPKNWQDVPDAGKICERGGPAGLRGPAAILSGPAAVGRTGECPAGNRPRSLQETLRRFDDQADPQSLICAFRIDAKSIFVAPASRRRFC